MPIGPGTLSPGGGDNDNNNMNMSMDNNDMMMMMHTSFFWGKDVIVLFSGWPNHSLPMYILACFFVFFLAASIEVISLLVKMWTPWPVVEACIYAVRMAVAYMVMLSVMSFNVGIFIAAVIGHSFGMFVVKVCGNRAAVLDSPVPNGEAKI
ncbi:Copper transporter 6 [Linum perenne]